MPQPFQIHFPEETIIDLKRRLAATRWPDEIDNGNWSWGVSQSYLQELCSYWQSSHDWEAAQERLNTFLHFKEEIDGIGLHFIHEKGRGKTATPLLLIHGWPDSFVRFLDIISLLAEPDGDGHAFDVIVPSIPSFAFSDKPTEAGMNPKRIAELFTRLMTEVLDYEKFIAQGGDWGSTISEQLGLYHEKRILGLHLTDVPHSHGMMPVEDPSAAEKAYLAETKLWVEQEGAYFKEQSTKPQTLGIGLNDSPAGLAAWIMEKFHTWTDNDGKPEDAVSRDALLTNLTIYWATQTATSSARIYYESNRAMQQAKTLLANLNPFNKEGSRSKPPAAFALFPKDISHPPKEFAGRFFNVQRWTKMDSGGHFAALEKPKELAADIRAFARLLQTGNE